MNASDENIKSHANEAALLNVLMYLDIKDVDIENDSKMCKIIDMLGTIYDSSEGYEKYLKKHKEDGSPEDYKDRQRQYTILVNACKTNEHFATLIINNQSIRMTNSLNQQLYKDGGLEACTFTDGDGNVKVVFRGTGKGEWIDNGLAISGTVGIGSLQQKEAVEYFDQIVKDNHYDLTKPNIEISGHSKGGNKAQFVTINSQYKDLIDKCYNFDGQGMSPEAIKEFKSTYGEDAYNKTINKMYGFYSENDFVNPLGIPVVPEDHRIYFKSMIEKSGIADNKKYHYSDDYLNLDGTFSEQTEQGHLSKLVEDFSLQSSNLPPILRVKLTNAFMGLMQGDNETVNGESVSLFDYIIGGRIAINILMVDLVFTPEGWATVDDLGGDALVTVNEKYGPIAELGAAIIMSKVNPLLFTDDLAKIVIKDFKAIAGFAIDNIKKFSDFIIGKLEQFGNWLAGIADDIGKALCKFAEGAKEAWGRVQTYVTGLYNDIVDTGKAVGAAIDNFKDKAAAAVTNFFTSMADGVKRFFAMFGKDGVIRKTIVNTWDTAMEKAIQSVDRIINATKSEIKKQYEAFKEGTHYLVTYAKKTLDNLGEKGVASLKAFGKNVAQGMGSYLSTRLSVDLFRLADLQSKLRNLERYMGERIYQILNEANRATADVGRQYSEYYVQQQIHAINRTCDQIRESSRRVCDELQRKTNSLQYALAHYQQIERLLCSEIRV